jgi:predicted lipoprotein with Yx(FWY)xxD motif
VALLLGLTGIVLASPAGAASTSTSTSTSTGTVISEVNSPYGKVLMVGSGQFAGYTLYQFSRNTPAACSATVETVGGMPLSCAGPETDKTADWPALTTVGKPVAGPGVNKSLLGLVHRTDIGGDQVTYAGRLLYLFDQAPHQFSGVNFMETVAPLPPWHGVWYLVSSTNGAPVEGPIALSTEALPSGKSVLAAAMFQGMGGTPITVYTYSKDAKNQSTCTGTCALDWPPVLTTAAPQATAGLTKSSMGTITRPDGTKQLTFDGKPLYLYSKEVPQLNPSTGNPLNPATIGTGNGLAGPAHFGGTFSVVSAPAAAPAA